MSEGVSSEALNIHRDGPTNESGDVLRVLVEVEPDTDVVAAYMYVRDEFAGEEMPAIWFGAFDSDAGGIGGGVSAVLDEIRQAPDVVRSRSHAKSVLVAWFDEFDVPEEMNFLSLGGDSISAVQLSVEIERVTGLKVPILALFDLPLGALLDLVSSQVYQHKGTSPVGTL